MNGRFIKGWSNYHHLTACGGEVKVFPTTDPERFLDLEYVILDAGRDEKAEIRNVKFFKNLVIPKFNGIDNINDIEMYKGRDLWVPREEAQDLDEDEYYIGDRLAWKWFWRTTPISEPRKMLWRQEPMMFT